MNQVNSSELARQLNLSKGRISQLVKDGRLSGCYTGDGRSRRFDLQKVAEALGQRLDPGQLLGNGAQTRAAIETVTTDGGEEEPPKNGAGATVIPAKDPSRYEMARTLEVEEKARRARRQNESEEGSFVLASEVAQETARQIAQEIASIEVSVLRAGARKIADELEVDFLAARAILLAVWRDHRSKRAEEKADEASTARLNPAEAERNF